MRCKQPARRDVVPHEEWQSCLGEVGEGGVACDEAHAAGETVGGRGFEDGAGGGELGVEAVELCGRG